MGVGTGVAAALAVTVPRGRVIVEVGGVFVTGSKRATVAGPMGVLVSMRVVGGNAAAIGSAVGGYNNRRATIPATEPHNNNTPNTRGTKKRGDVKGEDFIIRLVVIA